MKNVLLLLVISFFVAGCINEANPVNSQQPMDEFIGEADLGPESLAKAVNTKLGFEELLNNRYIQKALLAGKTIRLEDYNRKYKLYPGITFSDNILLGYDAEANPGLGGQVFLYVDGRQKSSITFTIDGKKPLPAYVKSFYARIVGPKLKKTLKIEEPILEDPKPEDEIILVVTGYVNDRPIIIKEKIIKYQYERYIDVVDEDLEKQLLKFENEVVRLEFAIKGRVHYYILDEFKYKYTTG